MIGLVEPLVGKAARLFVKSYCVYGKAKALGLESGALRLRSPSLGVGWTLRRARATALIFFLPSLGDYQDKRGREGPTDCSAPCN
jgi:hypothetical protein